MHRTSSIGYASAVLWGSLSLAIAGCGGMIEGTSAGASADDSPSGANVITTTEALRGRRRAAPPASTGGSTSTTTTTGTATATPATVEEAIAAAQTPDGRAIPQPAGPDGACPAVLTFLGFWSCPTIGETCAFSSADGVNHPCLCQRTDGEGQTPSWVCQ